ncbi:hypothetical protein [Noviherbaspirillum saxi]|uniref:Proline-rich protein n=1 Tax=Noviherbaspirillum saxi TaxID=2320863 RepID=A0A3A3FLB8_9BURK|nr:hypothetical protein [Noviherbaspirillum saxi]RJF96328.1 hypothetical protein D3871_20800 [Noviherbaspirillum saxi]
MSTVFDKTDKGREEIATRKYHVASRLRTLLVMVDGKHSAEDLLHKVAGIGLTADNLNELLEQGFIQKAAEPVVADTAIPVPAAVPAAMTTATEAPATTPAANSAGGTPSSVLAEGQSQFEAIYRFYTETIKSTIGLRGYGLQLKVEKASSIDEFRQIRQAYLEGVLKAQGPEMARSLRERLDQLLYLNETAPPMTTIIGISGING